MIDPKTMADHIFIGAVVVLAPLAFTAALLFQPPLAVLVLGLLFWTTWHYSK